MSDPTSTQDPSKPDAAALGFDPDALRAKYREERDKRLRKDGNAQYQAIEGDFSHYVHDPYVEPGFKRDALKDEIEVVIIGGGFGGLIAGARLKEAGIQDIRIIESGGDFGGTWYWNRYPGAQCDIESYIYLPLLEELGYIPKEKYSHGPEILEHAQSIGRHFGLYEKACFQTQVKELRWDEASARWIVTTDRDDEMKARFILMANGPLSRPKLPGIPGIDTFQGHSFHTSRWDYGYTGGDSTGNLEGLKDKRVGIIGTGATAIQCVPHLGASAKELLVFQRTPSCVDFRGNRPTDQAFIDSLEPGWQKKRMDNFNTIVGGGYQEEDLVGDGWTDLFRTLVKLMMADGANADLSPEAIAAKAELADFQKMEQVRARIENLVDDPETAESLKPYYRQFCKRPCFHDEYLQAFNRPNVHLIDTQGQGVERVTENSVVVDGKEHAVDCLIFATGFEVGTRFTQRAGYEVHGRDGLALTDKWSQGLSTFHGFFTRGFPNCFFMMGFQSGFTPNIPHAIDEQSRHLAYVLSQAVERGARTVEPTEAAESDWVRAFMAPNPNMGTFQADCTPGYYNNEGKPDDREGWFGEQHPEGSDAYFSILRDWREKGTLPGLEIS